MERISKSEFADIFKSRTKQFVIQSKLNQSFNKYLINQNSINHSINIHSIKNHSINK